MNGWTWQVGVGLVGGAVVFLAVLLPAIVVQYRRYGRLSGPRLVGLLAVSVYVVALFAYVLLPLPDPDTVCGRRGGPGLAPFQWRPFGFVDDVRAAVDQRGWRAAATGWALWQVLFNVALFVPLGVVVRRYLGRGVLAATLIGLAVSSAIEFTQWSAIYGLYPCNYRVGDVDDLIANTTGALIGAIIAPALLFWMPQARDLRHSRSEPRPVGLGRRWMGMLLDGLAFTVLALVLTAGAIAVHSAMAGKFVDAPGWVPPVAAAVAGLVVFHLPALRGSGASPGQAVVWIAPRWPDPTPVRRLGRATVTGGVFTVGQVVGAATGAGAAGWVQLLCWGWTAVCLLAVPFTTASRGRPGLSGLFSGATMVDSRATGAAPPARAESTDPQGPATLTR